MLFLPSRTLSISPLITSKACIVLKQMPKDDDKNKQNTAANILAKEIESWKSFAYALREDYSLK